MKFWCARCGNELEEKQTAWYHSLGRMCLLCRSGRVIPLHQEKKDG